MKKEIKIGYDWQPEDAYFAITKLLKELGVEFDEFDEEYMRIEYEIPELLGE